MNYLSAVWHKVVVNSIKDVVNNINNFSYNIILDFVQLI